MSKTLIAGSALYLVLSLSLAVAARNDTASRPSDSMDKTRMHGVSDRTLPADDEVRLTIAIAFAGESGSTVTDENGIYYTAC